MIKLFWNTHNQIKHSANNKSSNDYIWGMYHKENSDKWIYEILNKVNLSLIEDLNSLESDDILIMVDSSIEKKIQLYEKLQLICSKIFLFHLGDESGSYDFSSVYKKCNFVWRTFCTNRYFDNNLVKCIPIGYKSGVLNKKVENRDYKWAFIGTPHKSSRHDLLFQLSSVKQFYCHKTEKFNTKIISVDEMSKVLSKTVFF